MKLQKCLHLGISLQGSHFSMYCHKSFSPVIRGLHENLPVILGEGCLEMQIKYAIKTKELKHRRKAHTIFCKLHDF